MTSALKIGELARLTGVPVETVRYYEREGLMGAPARSQGNYRLYSPAQVEQLQFIRHCRLLDMTLDEIRSLLSLRAQPEQSCGGVNELLDRHIGHVAARIRDLTLLQAQLRDLRRRCPAVQTVRQCEILQSLATPPAVEQYGAK